MQKITMLFQSGKTIFTIHDLRLIWNERNPDNLKSQIKYYVDNGNLARLKRGVYTLSKDYDPFELAQKLIQPSYISLYSALAHYGIIFQPSTEVTSMTSYWRKFIINGVTYTYHALQDRIFFHPLGIIREKNYWIACKERAIADTLYLKGETFFDNLDSINAHLLQQMAEIYEQESTANLIHNLIKSL